MRYALYTDGGSRGNPGPSASGWVIYELNRNKKTIISKGSLYLGIKTNNFAEYTAIVEGLKECVAKGIKDLDVIMDSELAVKQINGLYKVKNTQIKEFMEEIVGLKKKFSSTTFSHVYRSDNKEADKMVNECLDNRKKA